MAFTRQRWDQKRKPKRSTSRVLQLTVCAFLVILVALLMFLVSIIAEQREILYNSKLPGSQPNTYKGSFRAPARPAANVNQSYKKWRGWPSADERIVYQTAPKSFPLPRSPVVDWTTVSNPCTFEKVNQIELFADHVNSKVVDEKCQAPDSLNDFVCKLQCSMDEPELEHSLRFIHTTSYRLDALNAMCRDHNIQIVVWILDNNARYLVCDHDGKLVGKSVFSAVAKVLHVASCLVKLSDVVFGMGVSDFAAPMTEGIRNFAPGWMQPMPATLRLVGSDAHPTLLFPTPSYLRATTHCNLNHEHWSTICRKQVPTTSWEDRSPIVFWRGSGTGLPMAVDGVIDYLARPAAVRKVWGKTGFDVAFVGEPNPSTKRLDFGKSYSTLVKPRVNPIQMLQHRYLLHLDGHSASWGGTLKLMSGSLVLWHPSQFTFREFYYKLLEPWVHYIPVARDFSNLEEIRDWLETTEGNEVAMTVAENSQKLFDTRLKPSDTYCYVVRMLESVSKQQREIPTEHTMKAAGFTVESFSPIAHFLK